MKRTLEYKFGWKYQKLDGLEILAFSLAVAIYGILSISNHFQVINYLNIDFGRNSLSEHGLFVINVFIVIASAAYTIPRLLGYNYVLYKIKTKTDCYIENTLANLDDSSIIDVVFAEYFGICSLGNNLDNEIRRRFGKEYDISYFTEHGVFIENNLNLLSRRLIVYPDFLVVFSNSKLQKNVLIKKENILKIYNKKKMDINDLFGSFDRVFVKHKNSKKIFELPTPQNANELMRILNNMGYKED